MQNYLASMYTCGEQARAIQTHRKIILAFFARLADEDRSPAQATAEDVTAFMQVTSLRVSFATVRNCLQSFYRFAYANIRSQKEYVPPPETLDLPPVQPRAQQERPPREKRNLPALDVITDNPWMECIAHYVRHIHSKSSSMGSATSYYGILKRFLREHQDPCAVVRRDIENFINRPCENGPRRGKSPSIATRNNRLATLSSFYKFAESFTPSGMSEPIFQKHNPCGGIYHGKTERIHRSINEEELARLFAVIPDTVQGYRDRAYFLCLLLTTRRREELARLRWGDIERGTVTGENSKTHQGYLYSYTSKGNGAQRFKTELPALAYHAIEKFLVISGRMDTIGPDDPIFIPIGPKRGGGLKRPNTPISGQAMNINLKRYAALAGLDPRKQIVVHSFRHTAIQQRLKAGQQPIDIMRVSGHKSMDSFYKYCNRLMGEADPGASAIEQKFSFLAK
jgi:integrase